MSEDPFRYELFAPLVGKEFRIEFSDGSVELTVEEVTELPPPRRKSTSGEPVRAENMPVRQSPFTVLFRGPRNVKLPQRVYRMTEPSFAEPLDIFIVPISLETDGYHYQAVFS